MMGDLGELRQQRLEKQREKFDRLKYGRYHHNGAVQSNNLSSARKSQDINDVDENSTSNNSPNNAPSSYASGSYSSKLWSHLYIDTPAESLTNTTSLLQISSKYTAMRNNVSANQFRSEERHAKDDSESEDDIHVRGPRRCTVASLSEERKAQKKSVSKESSASDVSDVEPLPNENRRPSETLKNRPQNDSSSDDAEDAEVIPPTRRPSILTDSELVPDPSAFLDEFAYQVAPQGVPIRCRITRDNSRYETYYLYMEREDKRKPQVFLMGARRRRLARPSTYLIFCEPTHMDRNSTYKIGEVHSNFVGTQFAVYDTGLNPSKAKTSDDVRREMAWTLYDTNMMGMKGPRHMTVLIPGMNSNHERIEFRSTTDIDSMLHRYMKGNSDQIIELKNKKPVWSEGNTKSYVLNFNGRVAKASVKNFQLIHENDPDYIALQFGRVKRNVFSMDYSYPFCAIQAFGIVLSSLDRKLLVE